MKLRDPKGWAKSVEVNGNRIDDYGGCVLYFAERWADAMEKAMAAGESLSDCADRLGHETDQAMGRYGLTGFQYGCAVSILSQVWEHGEELRRWHNLKTQIGHEGERANEKEGAVLNPALLNIGEANASG